LPAVDAGIGILSFKSKMHTIGNEVLDGVIAAVKQAEGTLDGVVIWHEAPFAVGANLQQVGEACAAGQFDMLEATVEKFQRASQTSSTRGAGRGCGAGHGAGRWLRIRHACRQARHGAGKLRRPGRSRCRPDPGRRRLQGVRRARCRVGRPVGDAGRGVQLPAAGVPDHRHGQGRQERGRGRRLGFAKPSDTILFNANELLWVAIKEARAMADAGYAPPPMARGVIGRRQERHRHLEMMLVNMKEGGMISAHDYVVARSAAVALCGGEVETGSVVDEEWLITVERRLFVELLKNPLTQARIKHMLETGKPLRN
jgi:3-hydroxyacyl-CoA dehydrogenase